jgi:lysophospholipase L1-like esterase
MTQLNVLMIGDSITAGFDTEKYFPADNFINLGVSGDSTVECLGRISEHWLPPAPDCAFICIGTNDFARDRTDEYILGNIQRIVEQLRRCGCSAPIFITSIFPTRENGPRPNDRIRLFNAQLEQQTVQMGCSFFDLHPHFTDDDGMLRKEFTDDGLHLTEAAYETWSTLLSAYLPGAATAE